MQKKFNATMNKQEFESRTSFTMPDERYAEVEKMYYLAGENIDKDVFCKDYKKHAESVLLNALTEQAGKLQSKLDNLNNELKETARILIRTAAEYGNESLRKQAIKILGVNGYLRMKIQLGIEFDSYDYEQVTEFL